MKKGFILLTGFILLVSCSSFKVVDKKEADNLTQRAHPYARKFMM